MLKSSLPLQLQRTPHLLLLNLQNSSPQPPALLTGGADRARTDDPLLAKQVLSQLSYSPPLDFRMMISDRRFKHSEI